MFWDSVVLTCSNSAHFGAVRLLALVVLRLYDSTVLTLQCILRAHDIGSSTEKITL